MGKTDSSVRGYPWKNQHMISGIFALMIMDWVTMGAMGV